MQIFKECITLLNHAYLDMDSVSENVNLKPDQSLKWHKIDCCKYWGWGNKI